MEVKTKMKTQTKMKVNVKVDLEHREKLKRLHTATHLLNFSAKKVLGTHIWQNGSNLKAEFGTLDITHYENLTQFEIFEIEKIANQVIFENRPIEIEEMERTQAERKYGFTLYQGGAIPMKNLRIIKILDNDIEACGGLHMESTGGIGLVKIIETQKIQDGVVRLKYVVNEYALKAVEEKQTILNDAKNLFDVDDKSIVKTCEKFFNGWKEQKKEIDKLKDELKNSYVKQVLALNVNEFALKGDFDMKFLMELFNGVIKEKSSFKLDSDKFIIATKDFVLKEKDFKKEIPKGKFSVYVI